MTKVIHIRDTPPGWKTNPEYVYIGRPGKGLDSIWGNPIKLIYEKDRSEVLQAYRTIFYNQPKLMEKALKELKDKTLVCFCSPKQCHGDVIAEFVNNSWQSIDEGVYD